MGLGLNVKIVQRLADADQFAASVIAIEHSGNRRIIFVNQEHIFAVRGLLGKAFKQVPEIGFYCLAWIKINLKILATAFDETVEIASEIGTIVAYFPHTVKLGEWGLKNRKV